MFQGNLIINEENDQAFISDHETMAVLCKLLNIKKEDCEKALCYRIVAARGELIYKGHSKKDAVYGKDALSKVGNIKFIL